MTMIPYHTVLATVFLVAGLTSPVAAKDIQHDAEYYVVQKQHAESWATEDAQIDARLKELRDKHGQPPNIVHIMWDDNGIGEFGNKLFNKIRGYSTPNINSLAEEGMTLERNTE